MIGKLLYDILAYSFLLIPLIYFFSKGKREVIPIVLLIYGILFFFLLHYYFEIPKRYRLYQKVLYTTCEYLTFTLVILLSTDKIRIKKIIYFSSFAFFSFQLFYLFSASRQAIDSLSIGIETVLIFVFSILYFIELFNPEKNEALGPPFYIIVAILIYLGPNLFFNLLANQLSNEQMYKYWHFTYFPEIIKNIIFAICILYYKKETTHKKQEIMPPPGFLDL